MMSVEITPPEQIVVVVDSGPPGPPGPPGPGILILDVGAPVPPGTPNNTVIFRKET